VLLATALSACGGDGAGQWAAMSGVIEGSVTYRERMLLPPNAVVEVQLEDISRADAPATVLEAVTLPGQPGPPYPFSLSYDAARIDPRMRYALRATISAQGRLLFTTTEYIDPFAVSPVEILVYRVAGPPS
jgi:putative lipoprotein